MNPDRLDQKTKTFESNMRPKNPDSKINPTEKHKKRVLGYYRAGASLIGSA